MARRLAATCAAAAFLLWPLAVGQVSAADPNPAASPITFARPQYLVFWESHGTYDGPVVDNAYALFTDPPVEPGHFVVPDGSGGVFHYTGRLMGGPYATDAELCPQMISLGITSLEAWPPSIVGKTIVVDCAAYRQTASSAPGAPSAAASPSTTDGPTGPGGIPSGDLVRLGGGGAGLALATVGGIGLVRGRRPTAAEPPPAQVPQEPPQPPDPCATQLADLHVATARHTAIADLLQTNRRLTALLDRQIVHLAN
ncbi:MAG: hypothetical protein E6I94_11315, partial [Chloroflexi bacterium]